MCISLRWFHLNSCHVCNSYFSQLYLHSPNVVCLCETFSVALVILPPIFICSPIFHFPSSTCSIMCALYVSARFRATRSMSEVAAPIVRDTLTWWAEQGPPAVDYLHRVWLLPAWLEPPNLHTRVTLIYQFQQQLSVQHFGPERDLRSRLAIFFAVMPDYIFNPVTWNKFLIQHLYCPLFWNSLRNTVIPEVIIQKNTAYRVLFTENVR